MNKTHAKRLLKLADFLSELPRKRFYYGRWVGDNWGGKQDLSCGTTACAFGWAATMPEFRRLGLCIAPGFLSGVVRLKDGGSSYSAAEKVFGLNPDEHDLLFLPAESGLGERATPKQVAKHIREFVKERCPEAF